MNRELAVLLHGRRVAVLTQDQAGGLTLTYLPDVDLPISLSMPLARKRHANPVVRAFCQGLLPDNEGVLERWGRDFQVSPGNPFALLSHVGEDCAGAVQFATSDRADALLANEGTLAKLTTDQIADRLRTLRRDPAAWHLGGSGQFSLAGAQAKTALHFDATSRQWGDPAGATPTTHILKPAITGFDDHDLNEHLCLRAADLIGLRSAGSRVESFGDERAIVVDRYDRYSRIAGEVHRIHQEDLCQALGRPPTAKYQSEGGPSPEEIIDLLRREIRPSAVAEHEVGRFVDALALNWLIAGTDAHAKNYSIMITPGQVRLAPLYDVASSLPYDEMYLPKLRLAMRIGSEYRVAAITGRHWRVFAERNRLDPEQVLKRIDEIADRLPDAFREAAGAAAVATLGSALPDRLTAAVTNHATECRRALVDG